MIKSEIRQALKNCDVIVHIEPCDKNKCFEVNGEKVCFLDSDEPEGPIECRCPERAKKGTA